MAKNPEARVTIKLFNEDFNKSLKEMKAESSQLRKEFVLQEQQMKLTASEAEKLGSKVDYLTQQQTIAAQKVAVTEAQYQRVKEQFGENSVAAKQMSNAVLEARISEQKLANELTQTSGALDKARAGEKNLASEMKSTTAEANKQNDALRKTTENLDNIGNNARSAGQTLSTGLTLPIVGVGVASAKLAIDFEAQMDRVGAIADATATDMEALRAAALELGASTSKSASEVALGMENMAAMGFTATEIIGAMPGVISAAEASGSDMAQTAEVMASTLNIFGLEASKANDVADILAKTANISAANLTDMQYALKYAGPPAAALGISLEELAAGIGIMTNAGMRGEQAGTTLRGALLGLLDPSEENSKLMSKMGIAITDNNGNFVGLSNLINNLTLSMEGQTETQKAATLSALVGREAVSGMLSLMASGPAEIDKMTAALQNSAGASEDAAAKMKDNLKGALDELGGTLETAAITIGNILEPTILSIATVVQQLVEKFQAMSPEGQRLIVIVGGILAAIGPLLVVLGTLILTITPIINMFGGLALSITNAGGVLALLTGPVGIAIAAIAGLIAIGVLVYKNWDTVREKALEVWNGLVAIVQPAIASVVTFVTSKMGELKSFWNANGQQILQAFTNIWTGIKAVIDFVMPAILFVIKMVWENIKGVIDGALKIIKGLIQVFAGVFTGDFSKMWEGIKSIFSGAIQFVWNLFNLLLYGRLLKAGMALFTGLKSIFTGGWTFIKSNATGFFTWIKTFATNSFNGMKTMISNVMSSIRTAISTKWTESVNFLKAIDLKQIGKDIINGLVNGIKSTLSSVLGVITDLATSIPDWAKKALKIFSPSRVMEVIGKWTGLGVVKGIVGTFAANQAAMNGLAKVLVDSSKSRNAEIAAINKQAAEEQKAITKKAASDIAEISLRARESKRKLTSADLRKIEKIERDSDAKVIASKRKAAEEIKKIEAQASADRLGAIQKFVDNKKKLNDLSLIQEVNVWREAIKAFKKGSQERIDAEANYQNALKVVQSEINAVNKEYADKMTSINEKLAGDIEKVNDDLLSKSTAIKDKLIAEEQRLNEEYDKAFESRYNSLRTFAGLFENFDATPKRSGVELLDNLQSQVDGFKSWEEEITKLAAKGIDQGLLQELRDMGPKALPQLFALNDLTSEQLTAYSALYQEKAALARSQTEEELIGMKLDMQTQLTELRVNADRELRALNVQAKAQIAQLRYTANAELLAMKNQWVLDIQSITQATSDEFLTLTDIGKQAGQNLMDGLKSMMPALIDTATEIAAAVNNALRTTTGGYVSVPGGSGQKKNSTNKAVTSSAASNMAAIAASTSNTTTIYNYNTIDAKNVADFNNAVKTLSGLNQVYHAN